MKQWEPSARDIKLLLGAWADGSKEALDRLAPLVYRELCEKTQHE
jgi:hypothetical protein